MMMADWTTIQVGPTGHEEEDKVPKQATGKCGKGSTTFFAAFSPLRFSLKLIEEDRVSGEEEEEQQRHEKGVEKRATT